MNKVNRIAIVGAGVAGLALAILATKQGHQVSLYERNSDISTLGAGVTLWSNAMFVVQQMGLEDDIKNVAGVPHFMHQFDQTGHKLAELDIDAVNRLSGYPSVTILRLDLMRILAKALRRLGGKIHFNASIDVQGIEALKQNYDLVVGADGRMNSMARKALYGEKVIPRYQGFINIIGISASTGLDKAICDFRGLGERFGIVPVNSDLCYWAAGWRSPFNDERPLTACYQEMHRRFKHWPEPVRKVLDSYDKGSLKHIFVHDIDPLPYWHQDNLVIIGDAAHAPLPTSGQGACQALEDAWHLVQCLSKQGELEKKLCDFYQIRSAKTSAAQSVGRQLAQTIFSTGSMIKPNMEPADISAQQLSAFWMQGLDAN